MSILTRMFTRSADPPSEQRSLTSIADPRIIDMFSVAPNLAGVHVSEQAVLGLSAVYRAVTLIAGGIATLPLRAIQDHNGITERVSSWLDNPAGGLTRFELIETTLLHLLLNGNAFLMHIYNNAGALCGVAPIHPQAVTIDVSNAGVKTYKVTLANGSVQTFSDLTMTHIRWLSTDGVRGLSPLQLARNGAFGTSLAADQNAAQQFGSGFHASAIATVPKETSPDDVDAIKADLAVRLTGVPNAGQVAVINRDLQITPWQLSPEECQWIAAREFQVEEIARIYGVPATLIGLSDKQSTWGTGIAEMHRAMARWTFMLWTERIQQRLSLILPPNRRAEFDYKGMLQPDPKTEIELIIAQVGAGLLSHAEARALMNRAPLPESERLSFTPATPQENAA